MSKSRDSLNALIDKHISDIRADGVFTLTVVELAKQAGLSRTSIYQYYPEVVERLKSLSGDKGKDRRNPLSLKVAILKSRVAEARSSLEAIAKVCVELMAANADLKRELIYQKESFEAKIASLEKRKSGSSVVPIKR